MESKVFKIKGNRFFATGRKIKKVLDSCGAERLCQVYYPDTGREVVHYKMEAWMIPLIEEILNKTVIWIK